MTSCPGAVVGPGWQWQRTSVQSISEERMMGDQGHVAKINDMTWLPLDFSW